MKYPLAVLACAFLFVLSACGISTAHLEGTNWILSELNGQPALADRTVTLQFEKDRLGGSDGCNSYGGSYTATGNKIDIGDDLVSTLMACEEPVMQQSSAFTGALLKAAAYKLEGDKLTLLDADGKSLAVFAPQGSPAAESPTETAQSAPDNSAFIQALANATYPIDLASTGQAQLSGGLFEEPSAPGSTSKTVIRLNQDPAFGDVNGDGSLDAAVTLTADPGGSGSFVYLALVINAGGAAKPTAAVLLGDRVRVTSLVVEPGQVVVTLLTRPADAPMSAEPSVEVTRAFQYLNGQLSEMP